MAIDFPNSPTSGDIYTVNNRSWIYNGYAWERNPITGSGVIATQSYVDSHTGNNDIHVVAGTVDGQVATWNNTTGAWEAQASGSGVSDHGSLTGLADDDHTQYLLADGTRTATTLNVTNNITVGGTVDSRDVAADGSSLDTLTGTTSGGAITRGSGIVTIDIGGTAGTARPANADQVYWICNNGITPTNAVEGDLIYNRAA